MAKREITLDYIRKLAHSVPLREGLDGNDRNDSIFFFQEWLEVDRVWHHEEEEHEKKIIYSEWNSEETDERIKKLRQATEKFKDADTFFSNQFVHIDENTRVQIDFAIAGLTWTLAQEPLFDFFRLTENKGIDKSIEKRMTEELDVEILHKYLDPRSPSFIEWKHLMAYVTMFMDHHSPAKKLLKNSKTTGDLVAYIPLEIEVRRFIEKLCTKEIDKKDFDAEIARLCG